MPRAVCECKKQDASLASEGKEAGPALTQLKTTHNSNSAVEHAGMGKYVAKHGPTKAARHLLSLLKHPVPESTARLFKTAGIWRKF